ncbi:MAG: LytR family transcriptional regulator [Actinomycetota bacterium]|nr:LytR family transcriptional regulator [Actinomycetota bacterium]
MTDDPNLVGSAPDDVPLPPVPPAGGARRSAGRGGAASPPVKKTPIGKLILITILGMGVLFGIGYGLGQFFRSDTGTAAGGDEPAPCVTVQVTPTPVAPDQVPVRVLNAGAPPGSAASTSEALAGVGFQIAGVGNGTTDVTTTPVVIRYGPTSAAAAKTLQAYLVSEATLQESPDLQNEVEMILVSGFEGVADPAAAQAKLSAPSPVASGPGCPSPSAPATGASENAQPEPTPAA